MRGIVRVFLDGSPRGEVDLYGLGEYQAVRDVNGAHGPDSAGYGVTVDAFDVTP